MRKRPELKVGDVVRVSKRYKQRNGCYAIGQEFHKGMVVTDVFGNGSDGRSKIQVLHRYRGSKRMTYFTFRRRDLWFTGKNVVSGNTKRLKHFGDIKHDLLGMRVPDPQKMDEVKCGCGRMADRGHPCWWCGAHN